MDFRLGLLERGPEGNSIFYTFQEHLAGRHPMFLSNAEFFQSVLQMQDTTRLGALLFSAEPFLDVSSKTPRKTCSIGSPRGATAALSTTAWVMASALWGQAVGWWAEEERGVLSWQKGGCFIAVNFLLISLYTLLSDGFQLFQVGVK